MSYGITTNQQSLIDYQAAVDLELGYPETVDDVTEVGGGTHADPNLGLAQHYAAISESYAGGEWAISLSSTRYEGDVDELVPLPPDVTKEAALPEDWYPPLPE